MKRDRILISGAGIAGLALARQLKKLDIPFCIIEKRQQLAVDGAGIALPANAVRALRYMGLEEALSQQAHQVNKIIYTDSENEVLSEASLTVSPLNMEKFVALPRHTLQEILQEGLEEITHFGTSIEQLYQSDDGVVVKFNNTKLKQEKFSAVIGADGANSSVRQLVFPETKLVDLGVTVWRWICRYPTQNLQPVYMFNQHDAFMVYPISDNEVYCYAHVYDPSSLMTQGPNHQANLIEQFNRYSGIAKIMLGQLPENHLIIAGRLRSMPKPMFISGRVALVGDASHACSPMLQQGAACAFEDVIVLSKLLAHFPIEEALKHYEQVRAERVNWILSLSDNSMKAVINADSASFSAIQQRIRDYGPLNVLGWKQLFAKDPLGEVMSYI